MGCEKKQVVKSDEAPAVQESAAKEEIALKSIYFDFNKAAIQPGDRAVLKEIADYLLKDKNIKISIEGNCDERGTDKYNLVLGDKRAKAAMTYLVNLGVDKKRIKTISNGKDKPLDSGHNEEAWAKNRRDDFVVK
jgi:peptidoglycan-associated lipoprotein